MFFGKFENQYPLAERFIKYKEDKAAVEMFVNGDKTKKREPKPVKNLILIIFCFAALYLLSMLLTTKLMTQQFEVQFQRNTDAVFGYLSVNFDGEMDAEYLNGIYDLEEANDAYQYFTVAVTDANGNEVIATDQYLRLKTHYFRMADYFNESEMVELLNYATVDNVKYKVKADIDGETNTLVSLTIQTDPTYSQTTSPVWEWKNKHVGSINEEQLIHISERTSVRQILSVPYLEDETDYEKWSCEKKGMTILSKNEAGDSVNQELTVKSYSHSLLAAMDMLTSVYIFGLVIALIGIVNTVYLMKRFHAYQF